MVRRKILGILIILFAVGVSFTGCKRGGEQQKMSAADSAALAKARQDSIARRLADSLQAEQEAEQEAARQAELEAQRLRETMKFHVIIGSFKFPQNAEAFLEVQRRSYPEAKIFMSPNNFSLVSIADFDSMQKAVAMINRMHAGQEEPTDLWVYEEGGVYDTRSYLENRELDDDGYSAYDSYDSYEESEPEGYTAYDD